MNKETRGHDGMAKMAKPAPHGASRNDKSYEHEEITDNRLVWEVLEEGDSE